MSSPTPALSRADPNREWKELIMDRSATIDANAMTRALRPLMAVLLESGPSGVDFLGLDPERVNGVFLAVALRATFRQRRSVAGWDRALDLAIHALQRDGRDPNTVLSGLLNRPPASLAPRS